MKRFFTLLELVVVIAIIGILASILLPSLSKARAKAEQAVCASNMRQVSISLNLFLNNNNHFFPIGIRNNWPYDDFIAPYDGRNLTQTEIDEKRFDNNQENRNKHKLYNCPSSKASKTSIYTQRTYGLNNGQGSWYKPNSSGLTWLRWSSQPAYEVPINIQEVVSPSNMYMLTENDIVTSTGNPGAVGHTNSSQGRYKFVTDNQNFLNLHGTIKINAVFVDGSTKIQRLPQLAQSEHWDRTQ